MIFRIIKNILGIQILFGTLFVASTFLDSSTTVGTPITDMTNSMFGADTYVPRLLNYSHHTIEIDSPGGNSSATLLMEQTIDDMKAGGTKVTTKVNSLAASAGAILFMQGDERIMAKTAILLFHGGHYGGYGLTQATLGKAKAFIDAGKLDRYILTGKIESVEDIYALSTINTFVQDPGTGLAGVKHTINSAYNSLKLLNDEIIDQVTVSLNKMGKRVWTNGEVQKELFADFEDDVIITADKALELGIATEVK